MSLGKQFSVAYYENPQQPHHEEGKTLPFFTLRAWRVPGHAEAHPSLKQAGNLRERFVWDKTLR